MGRAPGSAEFAGQANVLRLFVGEAAEQTHRANTNRETVVVLEANLDDMNPQIYGYFADRALAAGALDVFSTAVHMKKNRPGQLVTVLCDAATEQALTELVFRETTTLGVRRSRGHAADIAARTGHRENRVRCDPGEGGAHEWADPECGAGV